MGKIAGKTHEDRYALIIAFVFQNSNGQKTDILPDFKIVISNKLHIRKNFLNSQACASIKIDWFWLNRRFDIISYRANIGHCCQPLLVILTGALSIAGHANLGNRVDKDHFHCCTKLKNAHRERGWG